jgi:regulator of protease activity HflC (stomatin/prohibitin superfamily)
MALVVKVPPGQAFVVERLGRYLRTLEAGTHMLVPVVDAVRTKVDLGDRSVEFAPQPVITADNVVTTVVTAIRFRVDDPVKATYEIADFLGAVEMLTVTALRNRIGSLSARQAIDDRAVLSEELLGDLAEAEQWGVKVSRAQIISITVVGSGPGHHE